MRVASLAFALVSIAMPGFAQQAPAQPTPTPPPAAAQPAPAPTPAGTPAPLAQPAPTPAPAAQPVPASSWPTLPRMQLERQFAGPLQDTIIQRWRDPADGTVCYLYLPITVEHSAPTASGYVQYGANTIGSISCLAGHPPVPAKAPR